MNRKQLTVLIVAGLIIGAAAIFITKNKANNQQTSNQKLGQRVVKNFPINDVERITVKHGSDQMNLTRKGDRWVVQERADYPANFGNVSDFLRKVWDLKVAQPVRVGEKQLARLELTPAAGTVVEFKDKGGKVLNTMVFGKKHMREGGQSESPFGGGGGGWPDGRYIMVGNDVQTVAVVSEPFANVEVKAADWIDKEFFKIEKHKSIAVTSPNVTNTWKIARESETNEWKLADAKAGEQLDAGKSGSVTSALSYPSFTDVATNSAPEQTGMDKPVVAKIETLDSFTYDIKVGKKVGESEDHYLQVAVNGNFTKERKPGADEKPEDKARLDKEFKDKVDKLEEKLKNEKALAGHTYIVPKYSIDPLFKDRKELLVEKKEEAKPEEKKEETKVEPPKKQETVKIDPPKPPPLPPGADKPATEEKPVEKPAEKPEAK